MPACFPASRIEQQAPIRITSSARAPCWDSGLQRCTAHHWREKLKVSALWQREDVRELYFTSLYGGPLDIIDKPISLKVLLYGQVASSDMLMIAVLPTEQGFAAARSLRLGIRGGSYELLGLDIPTYQVFRRCLPVHTWNIMLRGSNLSPFNHIIQETRAFLYVGVYHSLPSHVPSLFVPR